MSRPGPVRPTSSAVNVWSAINATNAASTTNATHTASAASAVDAVDAASTVHAPSLMRRETQQAPAAVAATLQANQAALLAQQVQARGAQVLLAGHADTPGVALPLPLSAAPELDGIVALARFDLALERLARHRGLDPDQPPPLRKVTLTA